MTENTQDARPTRWALYHGTSTLRLKGILADNRLQTSPWGDPKIALTPLRSVAEYFACNAVNGDRHDHPDDEVAPVPEDRWRAYCAAAFEHRKEMFKPDAASVAPSPGGDARR